MPEHKSRFTADGANATSFSHIMNVPVNVSELLVVVRHGQATDNITHTLVQWNGTALTQIGGHLSFQITNPTRRRMSLWHLTDPEDGTFNITGTFSSQVAQYSVTGLMVAGSGPPDLTSFATLQSQPSATSLLIDITPDDAGSLIYVGVAQNIGTADPYAIAGQTDVEVEDSDVNAATTNHNFASGYGDVVSVGVAQSMGFTSTNTAEWGAFALEFPPVAGAVGGIPVRYAGRQ